MLFPGRIPAEELSPAGGTCWAAPAIMERARIETIRAGSVRIASLAF
jgi:hypothetical protein